MATAYDPPQPAGPRHAVVAIIIDRGRALFVRRSHAARAAVGYWTPVSGGVEPGESEVDAVVREVREEVDLTVAADAKVASIPTHDGGYLLHFWTCRLIEGTARVTSVEVADLRWCTPGELSMLSPVFEEDVRIVLAALALADDRERAERDARH